MRPGEGFTCLPGLLVFSLKVRTTVLDMQSLVSHYVLNSSSDASGCQGIAVPVGKGFAFVGDLGPLGAERIVDDHDIGVVSSGSATAGRAQSPAPLLQSVVALGIFSESDLDFYPPAFLVPISGDQFTASDRVANRQIAVIRNTHERPVRTRGPGPGRPQHRKDGGLGTTRGKVDQ